MAGAIADREREAQAKRAAAQREVLRQRAFSRAADRRAAAFGSKQSSSASAGARPETVSYTHLTLPTILLV